MGTLAGSLVPARLARLACGAAIAVVLASCADSVPGTVVQSGALSSTGPSDLCTYAPDDWTTRCASHLGTTVLCHALATARTTDERERAALDLNVAIASGLGAQHFVHGARIAWSVDDVVRLARAASAAADVPLAVHDANRAYTDCIDHAVLADWITTPVCGLPAANAVQGPASSRCVALDGDCRRGRFDGARGCCDEWDMPAGMVCGEDDPASPDAAHRDGDDLHADRSQDDLSHGAHDIGQPRMCTGRGTCVPASDVPAAGRALGVATWIEPVRIDRTPPAPSVWYLEAESSTSAIEIRLDGAPAAIVPASQEGHRTRVGVSLPGTLGVTTLDLGSRTRDSVVRSLYLPRRISLNTDLANGETYEVCAASGSFDALPTLVGECPDEQRVTCPSAAGAAIRCAVDPRGYSVVTGPGLSLAWERDPIEPCPAPSCPLALYPDGGAQCVVFAPGSCVVYVADPNGGGVTCELCPDSAVSLDVGPPDVGPRDAGTDASLPIHTNILDPVLVGLVVLTRPGSLTLSSSQIHVLCRGSGCPGTPSCRPTPCLLECEAPGTSYCVAGHHGVCRAPLLELCNGLDDDCDARIDEYASWQCDDHRGCTEDVCTAHVTGAGDPCRHYTGAGGAGGALFPSPPSVGPDSLSVGGLCTHALATSCTTSGGCTPVDAPACEVARCAPSDLDTDPAVTLTPTATDTPLGAVALGDRTTPSPVGMDRNGCVFIERDETYCIENSPYGHTPPTGGGSSGWPIPQNWQLCAGPRPICAPRVSGADPATGCIDYCRTAVTPGTPQGTVPAGGSEGECSGVFSPRPGAPGGVLSIGYNAFSWAASTNAGTTWLGVSSGDRCTAVGGCLFGSGSGPIPAPDGVPAGRGAWAGDIVLSADGRGNVVAVNMYTPVTDGSAHIAVAISTDGGLNYSNSLFVDAPGRCVFPTSVQNVYDQPAVFVDRDFTTPRVWVAWRHQDYVGTAWGGCLRGGDLAVTPGSAPTIRWDALGPTSIELQRETADDPESTGWGDGGLRLIARRMPDGHERVSVAYARNGSAQSDNCDTANHAQSWHMASSDDGGVNWSDSAILELPAGSYRWCAVPQIGTLPHVMRGVRDFDLATDPVGSARWVALSFNTTLQVYFTINDLDWNLVHQITSDDSIAAPEFLWDPSIAVDEIGNVAVTYYGWQPAGVARWVTASAANRFALNYLFADGSWSAARTISRSTIGDGPFFPPSNTMSRGCQVPGSNCGGDYMTTFPVPAGLLPDRATFMAGWSQGTGPTSARLMAAPFGVVP